MKFTVAATLAAALITTSFAQSISIGSPANRTTITPGSSLLVQVDRPETLSGSIEVAVVIGIQSCGSSACMAPGSDLGIILFNGPFEPQLHPSDPTFTPPHENFTVTIPSTLSKGPAQLSVFHATLIGALLEPITETKTVILYVK